jgi:hypothetical protein
MFRVEILRMETAGSSGKLATAYELHGNTALKTAI